MGKWGISNISNIKMWGISNKKHVINFQTERKPEMKFKYLVFQILTFSTRASRTSLEHDVLAKSEIFRFNDESE